jgi:hypothetical protein
MAFVFKSSRLYHALEVSDDVANVGAGECIMIEVSGVDSG